VLLKLDLTRIPLIESPALNLTKKCSEKPKLPETGQNKDGSSGDQQMARPEDIVVLHWNPPRL